MASNLRLAMVIVAVLYLLVLWLLFGLRVVRLTRATGAIAAVAGVIIVAVFAGLLAYLTPSGVFQVMGRVVEVTPNVAGPVTDIAFTPNAPVKAGAVLFRIDPTPFAAKVRQLQAALADARQKVEQMRSSVAEANADVTALTTQVRYSTQRREDYERLTQSSTASRFQLQDIVNQEETQKSQLLAAQAKLDNAKLALASEIGGENTAVAQVHAQLDNAQWNLDQTTVKAPADGFVTVSALTVGDRVSPLKSTASFVVSDQIGLIGIFPQNGFQAIKPGMTVMLVFENTPGRIFDAQVEEIAGGIGEGQVAVSGSLTRLSALPMTGQFIARLSMPKDFDPDLLRLGMAGDATVVSDRAGVVGFFAWMILFAKSYVMYL